MANRHRLGKETMIGKLTQREAAGETFCLNGNESVGMMGSKPHTWVRLRLLILLKTNTTIPLGRTTTTLLRKYTTRLSIIRSLGSMTHP